MSNKLENLKEKIKSAIKVEDKSKYHTLKFLLSKIQNAEIEARGVGRELTDSDFDRVVLREIKSHEESITAYQKGGRKDLADKESKEIEVLQSFAPPMMKEEEIKTVVETTYQNLRQAQGQHPVEINLGRLMGEVMLKLKGKADGEIVRKVVQEVVAKSN